MNKLLKAGIVTAVSILLTACATAVPVGAIYTDIKLPVNVTANGAAAPKVGIAECKSILAMFATGDCSIESAKKNGGIQKVYHVDWHADNILGIIGKYKLTVYGE